MKRFLKRKNRRSLGLLLGLLLSFSMGMTTFAAEPNTPSSFDVNTSSEVESSSSALSLTAPSGRILSEKAVRINASQMYEVTFATESRSDSVILPRSIYGYAAYDAHSSTGSFKVYAPGNATGSGGITLKTSGFAEGTPTYMSVARPDGTTAVSNVSVPGNSEVVKSFSNAQPGYYTVYFTIYGTSRGQFHTWIY